MPGKSCVPTDWSLRAGTGLLPSLGASSQGRSPGVRGKQGLAPVCPPSWTNVDLGTIAPTGGVPPSSGQRINPSQLSGQSQSQNGTSEVAVSAACRWIPHFRGVLSVFAAVWSPQCLSMAVSIHQELGEQDLFGGSPSRGLSGSNIPSTALVASPGLAWPLRGLACGCSHRASCYSWPHGSNLLPDSSCMLWLLCEVPSPHAAFLLV